MLIKNFFQSIAYSVTRRELYEFTRGESKFYYTSGDKPVQDGETIYDAITLSRSEIEASNDLEKNSIDITFALNSEFAQDCLRSALEENVLVKISKLQYGSISIIWQGRVTSVKPDGAEITLKCETDYTSLGRAGARYKYQRSCAHDLYGRGCKLNKDDWKVQTTIKSIDGMNVEFRGLSVADNYFRLGMMQDSFGVYVGVEGSSGNTATLIRRFDSLSAQITTDENLAAYNAAVQDLSDAQADEAQAIADRDALDPESPTYAEDYAAAQAVVDAAIVATASAQTVLDVASESVYFVYLYPGCLKSLNACNNFGNTDNFLGFPYMPEDNPTTTRIV